MEKMKCFRCRGVVEIIRTRKPETPLPRKIDTFGGFGGDFDGLLQPAQIAPGAVEGVDDHIGGIGDDTVLRATGGNPALVALFGTDDGKMAIQEFRFIPLCVDSKAGLLFLFTDRPSKQTAFEISTPRYGST